MHGKTLKCFHLEIFPAKDGTEVSGGFSVHPSHNLPLSENGEPLVQPEVLEVDIGHQVAGPGVGDLVGDHIRVGLVPREEGGGGKGEAGVLHPAKGEGGGQDKDVIDAPDIGAAQLLCLLKHRLCLREIKG